MNQTLSVIVNIYNVAQYLEQCICSILEQTYRNLEIILVDDGSTDGSSQICDFYSKKDTRVRVIHKKNEGLVCARKAGLNEATAEYITFVDGDDWLEIHAYETLMNIANIQLADVVTSGIIQDFEGKCTFDVNRVPEGLYEKAELEKQIYPVMMHSYQENTRKIDASLCNKIFKKDLIKKAVLSVDPNIFYLGEDAASTYPCMLNANTVYISHECLYHHRIITNVQSREYKREHVYERWVTFYKYLSNVFSDSKYKDIMMPQLEGYFFRILNDMIVNDIGINVGNYFRRQIYQKENMKYIFPIQCQIDLKNVIIYGAGVVGENYYRQFIGNGIKVLAWVDKNYKKYKQMGYPVTEIKKIKSIDYNYIIIAVLKEEVAQNIRQELKSEGINEKKLIWIKPQILNA